MELDISDILADVHSSSLSPQDQLASTAHLDHQQLTRLWTSERTCPDILPWPTELMQRVMARVQAQIARIEDLAAGIVPTNMPGHGGSGSGTGTGNQNLNLTLSILQTDLSRTQFLVRSLLRQRLAKLTKHAAYYLAQLSAAETKETLLSPAEAEFLRGHQALLAGLYGASFLEAFPAQLRRLDDTAGGVSMVEGPEGKASVFVRCLSERWGRSGEGEGEGEDDDDDEGGGGGLRMRRGDVWVVRWEDVKKGVLGGSLELL
jgi:GINS complex subunit 4